MTATDSTTRRGIRPARGFSMLELLIAMLLLGLGLVMAATIFPVALDQHRESVERVSAMQVSRNARRLVQSFLAPHVDPGRDARTAVSEDTNGNGLLDAGEDANSNGVLDGWYDDNRDGWPDERDRDGDGVVDPDEDPNGNGVWDPEESYPRGPIRGDSGEGYHLLHFETIFDDPGSGYPVVSAIQDFSGALYVDVLNDGPGTVAWQVGWSQNTSPDVRAPWFRIEETVSPAVRWLPASTATAVPRELATTGSPFDGQLSRSSYVWHAFYRRPTITNFDSASDVAADTNLTYVVSVCQFGSADRFAFQDPDITYGTPPRASNSPEPLQQAGNYSLLPVAWRVSVEGQEGEPNPIMEWNGDAIGSHDPPEGWGSSVRLSQLAPRGSRLLGNRTGTVYTVIRSPATDASVIEVLPEPRTEDRNDNGTLDPGEDENNNNRIDLLDEHPWLFPPAVVLDAGGVNVQSWKSDSPLVDWYD